MLQPQPYGAVQIVKIAWRARSIRDNLELFDLLAERPKPTAAMGLGPFGLMSRVLSPKFGGFMSYAALEADLVEIVVQVNGKLRGRITVAPGCDRESAQALALQGPNVQRFIEGKTVRKVIHVPDRLLNIVVG